jgi:hypothetical protein
LNELYGGDWTKFKNVKLLLSDAAPYALKAGKLLKEICPDLKHVTCICHCLHNLYETITSDNDLVDTVIAYIKKKLN